MTHITCRLTAKNRDQLRNPTLGNRVWATFTFNSSGDVAVATNIVDFVRKMKIHRMCISVTLSTELIRWTQAASGAAGWANVALCAASALLR